MPSEDFLDLVRSAVGDRYVLTDASEIDHFATDHRGRYHGTALAVVRPASTAEVAAVVTLCAAHGVAVTPQGGNTGLCGGATPLAKKPAIILRLDRLNRVRHGRVVGRAQHFDRLAAG